MQQNIRRGVSLASDNPPAPPGTPPSMPPDPDGPAPIEEPPSGIPVPDGPEPLPVRLDGEAARA